MSKWGWATRIGGFAAAPWTFGLSIPASQYAASEIEKKQAANDTPAGPNTANVTAQHPEDPYTALLKQQATGAQATGQQMTATGSEALGPVLQYFRSLMSSDPQAMLQATQPERGRVIDQYDAARKAIANFGPRGGGTTSTLAQSRFDQAESLGDLTSGVRRSAAGSVAEIGTSLAGLGLTAQDLASRDLNTVINSVMAREGLNMQRRGQNMQMIGDIGETIGTLIGIAMGGGNG